VSAPETRLAPGDVLGKKYRITSELGAGGFGRVYAAENSNLGTPVAIKVVHPGAAPGRLLREAQLAAALRSPHSVRVFDSDRLPDGTPYIVMELLSGETLRDYLRRERRVLVPQALEWTLQLCLALREAHAAGLVHRDVKPSNVFLVSGLSVDTHVKLVDFGLAKSVEPVAVDAVTDSGVVVGTPFYMAPERVRASEAGPAADQWSVGVVLFEALSGTLPFAGDSTSAIFAGIAADPPRPLQELAPEVPPEVVRLVTRCLRKRPEDRFPTIDDLAQELRTIIGAAGSVPPPALALEDSHTVEETYAVTQHSRRFGASRVLPAAVLALLVAVWLGWLSRTRSDGVPFVPSAAVIDHASAAPSPPVVPSASPAASTPTTEASAPHAASRPAASASPKPRSERPRPEAPAPSSARPKFFAEPDF